MYDQFEAVSKFPQGQPGTIKFRCGAGIDLLLGIGQREGIDAQFDRERKEKSDNDQDAYRP